MSGFWLGAFVALSIWKLVNAVTAAAMLGKTRTYGYEHVVGELAFCVVFLTGAVLVYTGVA